MSVYQFLTRGPVGRMIGSRRLQPFWAKVHRMALLGQNYGGGYNVATSGEAWVLQQFFRACQLAGISDPLIFDVGANAGEYVEMIRRYLGEWPWVCAFEPSPMAFGGLESRLGSQQRLFLYNFGLGDSESEQPLYSNEVGSVVSTLHVGKTTIANLTTPGELCRIRTLDSLINEPLALYGPLRRINLLKLDVEGNELAVVIGAKNALEHDAVDVIQFEFGEVQLNAHTCFRDLYRALEQRYRIFRVLRNGLAPLNSYNEILEVYRTTNFLAVHKTTILGRSFPAR